MNVAKKNMWRSERKNLIDLVPMEVPMQIHIEVSTLCNLKCICCLQSLNLEEKRKTGFNAELMSLSVFKKIIDDCAKFKHKIPVLRIAGLGEPMTNPKLEEMLKYARDSKLFEKIILFTNGIFLNEERCNALIACDINSILLDVQGITSEDYLNYTSQKIDFDLFIKQLKYLYNHKHINTKIFIQIYRFVLKNETSKNKFFEIFSSVSDEISINNIYEAFQFVDYSGLISNVDFNDNPIEYVKADICPYPFFQMTINADGFVWACCNTQERIKKDLQLGNVIQSNLFDIWHNYKFNRIREDILLKNECDICKKCNLVNHLSEFDIIDGKKNVLLNKYKKDV